MRKFLAGRKSVLIIGLLSLLALVFLVSSLASLVFKPAVPFAIEEKTSTRTISTQPLKFPYLLVLFAFAVLIVVLFFLLPKEQRRRFLLGLLEFLVVGLIIFFIILQSRTTGPLPQPTPGAGTGLPPAATGQGETPLPTVTPTPYTPPVVPAWASLLVALAVLIPAGVGFWWLLSRRSRDEFNYEKLSGIAQSALDDLGAGRDWGEAVINCYYRMTRAVEGRRGLKRRRDLTPTEFVSVLEQVRLPGEPLRRLTLLFERVRYGARRSTQTDIDEAVACLEEIVAACREVVL